MDVGSEARPEARPVPETAETALPVPSAPQPKRAWGDGARGEELLGQVLAEMPGIVVLHDRRMPRTRANIDHIVIGPAGVFVVDAKRYAGRIGIHNKGSIFRADYRLYVGRRDCSGLAEKVVWQAKVVKEALEATGGGVLPPITPVLCFVDGDWPLINPPSTFGGVRVESERTIKRLVAQGRAVEPRSLEWATRILSAALPAK
ncbi:MAG TPA: nuclease-related domain-containing protein [Candidatus Limnocylindrales bacterium]|nr:nuclease-related domain-containing protein [Candidatus Limnocylindrales bacterium]